MTPDKMKKLPKYAQDHINSLEQKVKELQSQITSLCSPTENSNIQVRMDIDQWWGLPKAYRSVRFYPNGRATGMDRDNFIDFHIEPSTLRTPGKVLVYGGTALDIEPLASNNIALKIRES
jgi:hypothetical protein